MNWFCWLFGHKRVGQREKPHPDGPGKITEYYLAPFCKRCGFVFPESTPDDQE